MCQKTPYSTYECSCFDGYTKTSSGNGQARCIDTNECEIEDDLCPGTYENCQNQEGSFFCMCMNGFARISMESVCEDVNECLDKSIHNCTENPKMFCFNYPGSFECGESRLHFGQRSFRAMLPCLIPIHEFLRKQRYRIDFVSKFTRTTQLISK